ncbi:MAG: DUF115 domain-containing protein [Treponema sp.]|nr:DUF115 domain-containing protein [Treponema sp.]
MGTGWYTQNLKILQEYNPPLAELIEGTEDGDEDLYIEEAAAGLPTMVCQGLRIHSKQDPRREAQRLLEASGGGNGVLALVLGFGLGYAAEVLNEAFPAQPMIIAEKRPEILKRALETRDLSTLLARKDLIFVLGGESSGLARALSYFTNPRGTPPLILRNRALWELDTPWYMELDGHIEAWVSRSGVNRATKQRFGRRWLQNLSKNLTTIRDLPGLASLEGLLEGKDIPVFLAAAGPGLDEAAPHLLKIWERALIVAVDTSFRFVLAQGVVPDFLVSVDPQYWNYRHLDRTLTEARALAQAPRTRLIAESAVYPPCLREPFEGIFLCSSMFPLGRFIEDQVDPKGELGAGGSVATSAWDFIRRLGARDVWIAGLDLSFPGLKTHFRGALFEEKSHAESDRFFPAETWKTRALRDGQPFMAAGRGGGQVLTDRRLSLYASWFENRFKAHRELRSWSYSPGGLEIPGLLEGRPEELLSLPRRREEIDSLLDGFYENQKMSFFSPAALENRRLSFDRAREDLRAGLREIISLSQEAAQDAGLAASRRKQGRLGEQESQGALRKLDAANRAIKMSRVRDIAAFMFPEIEEAEEGVDSGADPLGRHLEYSARFYKSLHDAAAENLEILESPGSRTP